MDSNMDFNRDEVRRQLRESQREHDALMPRFRSVLARVFDPKSTVPAEDKARLLGVDLPSRRLLLGGGATLAGAAALAACTPAPKKEQLAQTGTVPDSKTTTTLDPKVAAQDAQKLDVNLLRTAQSLEALAIVVYDLAIASGKVTTTAIADGAKLFRNQHQDHRGLLVAQIRETGGKPYANENPMDPKPDGVSADLWAQVNPSLWKEDVEPVLKDADKLDEKAIVKLATALEDVAAQTYAKLGGTLSTPSLREAIMSIGGIEARHVAVLLGVTANGDPRQQAPFPFEKTGKAVPEDDWVGAGEVDTSAAKTTTTTQRPTGTTIKAGGSATTVRSGAATTVKPA